MSGYVERYYQSADGLRLHYRDYANARAATPVLCIPGLTRNSRDFEFIAAHIAKERRVLTVDLRGRGKSAYDPNPQNYTVPVETADVLKLLEAEGLERAAVLGTSRGGIIAMAMAAAKPGSVRATILNDIGAEIPAAGLQALAARLVGETSFASWDEAAKALRRTNANIFPNVGPEQWLAFAHAIYCEKASCIMADRDPRLLEPLASQHDQLINGLDLWPLFVHLREVPLLVLRGEHSDLLSADTLTKMIAAKPDLTPITVRERGHVPFLDEPDAVAAIDAFLETLD